jgi:hypothetical protein
MCAAIDILPFMCLLGAERDIAGIFLERFYIMRVEDFISLLLVISNYKEVDTFGSIPALHPLFHSWISVIHFYLLTAKGAVLQA